MRLAILLPLFFLFSCASGPPERNIASDDLVVIGEADSKLSIVKFFSDAGHPDIHHFYLELRSSDKKLTDVDLKDIQIKVGKTKLNSYIRRISLGRYEIEVDHENLDFNKLKFLIQSQTLKHKLEVLQKPVKKHSSIKIISNENHRLKVRLTLKDKNSKLVEVKQVPDIIFSGLGEASALQKIKKGVWEFEISYPEDNQILYLSVRANGVSLDKLFRFQYVEK